MACIGDNLASDLLFGGGLGSLGQQSAQAMRDPFGEQQRRSSQDSLDALSYAVSRFAAAPAVRAFPPTFREELQHEVDQWLKNAL